MNITSKCRCGAEFSVDYTPQTTIHGEYRFKDWLELHKECPQKMFTSHISFKYLLRKAQEQ